MSNRAQLLPFVFTRRVLDYFAHPDELRLNARDEARYIKQVIEWKAWDREVLQLEKKWSALFVRFFDDLRSDVVRSWLSTPIAEVTTNRAMRSLESSLPRLFTALHSDVATYFLNRPKGTQKARSELLKLTDIADLQSWLKKMLVSRIKGISKTTETKMKKFFAAEIKKGTAISVIAEKLEKQYLFSPVRAERIARTEVIGAANAASYYSNAAALDPKDLAKTWIATKDHRTRPTHVKAGATQVDVDYEKPFHVGTSLMMFPGDSSLGASAKEIIRCRCTFSTSFDRKPRKRRSR